ncbi:ROK family protein [Bacillus inaquosorum]|nr:ROK family protein [Bacillus inaquosorum]
MGHMTIDFNGPKCSCGNRGRWELYVCREGFINISSDEREKVSTQDIIELAHLNDIEL